MRSSLTASLRVHEGWFQLLCGMVLQIIIKLRSGIGRAWFGVPPYASCTYTLLARDFRGAVDDFKCGTC